MILTTTFTVGFTISTAFFALFEGCILLSDSYNDEIEDPDS